ncbi:MAG: OmpA family protein [Celeribacter sp.]|jgi:outer membrane protein OmpA-like peptidoglycan-associated protein
MRLISKALRGCVTAAAVFGLTGALVAGSAAQAQNTVRGERYAPTIWVDPDGCEHWVMDDGWEGYMSPHVNRDGRPVCRRGNVCAVMEGDQLFATDQSTVSANGRARLAQFFRQTSARGFVISGHTDSRATDAYNMGLSQRRANAVAQVARSVGAPVVGVQYYGERVPRASNATPAGRQQNRRVEITCVN